MVTTRGSSPSENTSIQLPWNRVDAICLALLSVAIFLTVRLFWQPGIASPADMLMGIYRIFVLDLAWQEHFFIPAWDLC